MNASRVWREVRRAVTWHRRLLAAGLTAAAVALSLAALSPAPPPTTSILVAARDLPGGRLLAAADLITVGLPTAVVPAGAVRPGAAVRGRLLAAPLRRGEPLTDVRLVGPTLLSTLARASPGRVVAVPVRIADPGAVGLLRAGDRVDVLAAATQGAAATRPATVVAADVPVLSVPTPSAAADTALAEGALLVVATDPEVGARLASAAVSARLSVALRAPPT